MPYKTYPKGCRNYNHNKFCPPNRPFIANELKKNPNILTLSGLTITKLNEKVIKKEITQQDLLQYYHLLLEITQKKLKSYSDLNLVYAELDFQSYIIRMKTLFPDWTPNQLKNLYYWQSHVRKALRDHIEENHFRTELMLGCGKGFNDACSIESIGINVFATLKRLNILLEVNPVKKVILIALIGKKLSPLEKLIIK